MTLLQVRGLAKSFGGVIALGGIDFDLAAGQMLALIGPNGAGKTTCFNLLNGQLRPDAGTVELDGRALTGRSPARIWRLGVGRTFQIPAIFAAMTVRDSLRMVSLSYQRRLFDGWRPARAYPDPDNLVLLDRLGIADLADQLCGSLAYGDLKRAELGMALIGQPRLLLMDEPTAGMAAAERQALMALTRTLVQERNLAVLFTEHDMEVVFGFADRVIVLARGQVIAEDRPDRVRSDPRVREVYLGGAEPDPGVGA